MTLSRDEFPAAFPASPAPQGFRPHPPLRLPRQSKARYSLAAVLRCSPCSSTASRRVLDRTNPAPMALSQVRWTNGHCRTIHSSTTSTSFSTGPSHGCMNSLAHSSQYRRPFRASRPSVSPFHPDIPFPSLPGSTSAIDSSLHSGPLASPPVLTTPASFYTPPSLHSICIGPASAAPAASF